MTRWMILGYGVLGYLAFSAVFVYFIGFVPGFVVPRTVDAGGPVSESWQVAVAIDLALVGVFALQHTVMARASFKRKWNRVLPSAIARSTFVLAASASLALLFWQWRPIPDTIWHLEQPIGRAALWGIYVLGIVVAFSSSFLIDHFELFGLRQVFDRWRGTSTKQSEFRTPLLYRFVRHPMMVGLVIAFWATPTMTASHALFASAMTVYLVVGVQLEERDLTRTLGKEYEDYKRRVPQLIPGPPRSE